MFDKKEHYMKNKEIILERQKKYYIKHREQILKRIKLYNLKPEIIKSHRLYHKIYNKQYYIKNREKTLKHQKEYLKNNKEKHSNCMKKWYKNNSESIKEYYEENRERIKQYQRQYINLKRRTDLKCNLNSNISRTMNYVLKGNKAGRHWEDLVGYTLNDLFKRLKQTMPEGYTWQDYMEGRLHIDHKTPISAHNFDKPEHADFKRCWALKNLRLLPAKENLIKGSKLNRPFQPALQI